MVSLRRNKIGEKLNGDRENWCSKGADARLGGRLASRSLFGGHSGDVGRVHRLDHDERRSARTWARWLGTRTRRLGPWSRLGPWPWLGRVVPSSVEQPALLLLVRAARSQALTSRPRKRPALCCDGPC